MFLRKLFGKSQDKAEHKGKTILVVDDNDVDRTLIEKILKKDNYNIISAKDGGEGLELAKRYVPDLILSDCNMPVLDGVSLFNKIKEDDRTMNIPFVFLTASDSPANLVDCFEMGAENYLCKPINSKVISSQINEILNEFLEKK